MTKILIIGAGAIGCFYGAKLAQSGAQVIIWARSDYDVIKNKPIKILSKDGDFEFTPYKILKNLSQNNDEIDYILIATKVLPDLDLPSLIKNLLNKNTKIILIQNGIHIEENIARNFPHHEIISIVAFVCVSRIASGIIHHQDYGKIILGTYRQDKNYGEISSAVNHLADMWQSSGIEAIATDNILVERWKKLVWNSAFNPLSVVLRGKNTQEIINNKPTLNLAKKIMAEICLVAEADGCKLPDDIIEKNILATEKMKPYKTSMLLDFEANRKMEVEAILGNVIKFAQLKSISTPYLSTIYAIISNL